MTEHWTLADLVRETVGDRRFDGLRKPCPCGKTMCCCKACDNARWAGSLHASNCEKCDGLGYVPISGAQALVWLLEFMGNKWPGYCIEVIGPEEEYPGCTVCWREHCGEGPTPWDAAAAAVGEWWQAQKEERHD